MKKIFRYTLAVLLGAMNMVACTNEYEYDAPSATDQGGNATISAAKTTYVFVPSDVQGTRFCQLCRRTAYTGCEDYV